VWENRSSVQKVSAYQTLVAGDARLFCDMWTCHGVCVLLSLTIIVRRAPRGRRRMRLAHQSPVIRKQTYHQPQPLARVAAPSRMELSPSAVCLAAERGRCFAV